MKSVLVGLSFAGAAVAQIVNGVSMVSLTYAAASSEATSAPAEATDSASYTTDASGAQYTAPPESSIDIYSAMPYDSMTAGGYSSLDCGYGYTKAYDGSCQAESWVGSHTR